MKISLIRFIKRNWSLFQKKMNMENNYHVKFCLTFLLIFLLRVNMSNLLLH